MTTSFNKVGAIDYRLWNMTVDVYTSSQQIIVTKGCFAFMFTNIGDTPATVNGIVVFPSASPSTSLGDSRTLGGHWCDLYKGNMTLSIQSPAGSNPRIEVVQLFYL